MGMHISINSFHLPHRSTMHHLLSTMPLLSLKLYTWRKKSTTTTTMIATTITIDTTEAIMEVTMETMVAASACSADCYSADFATMMVESAASAKYAAFCAFAAVLMVTTD